jgi:hypothetical protein
VKTISVTILVVLLSLFQAASTNAQQTPAPTVSGTPSSATDTIASQLNQQLSFVETEVVDAAKAMPEEKYAFVPTNGEF